MDRDICQDLSSTKTWQMNLSRCYQRSIDNKILQWIKKLSRIYRPDRKYLYGLRYLSRFYREKFSESSMDRYYDKISRDKKMKSSIERNLSRSCRGWRKKFFKRREKHIKMNATSKQLNIDPINILSSQNISQQENAKHSKIQKKEHTHTHNKSNQFYFSKTS